MYGMKSMKNISINEYPIGCAAVDGEEGSCLKS
jgi:hypothetical protein